jgi:hypothetical protein
MPVPWASVSIYDETATALICSGSTDTSGRLVVVDGAPPGVALDDGTYTIKIYKPGYNFAIQAITVSEDESFAITGTTFAPSAPSSPELCVIYGWVRKADGQPATGAKIQAFPLLPSADGGYHISGETVEAIIGTDGKFEIELQKKIRVIFKIPTSKFSVTKTVPDANSQRSDTWV